ncbi:nuclear transport factor 2 family protein [Actinoplanes oblitus]|uniref:Nuclear transport factor 2 family protein n=1 Tax=Actinoplanes oblitus TaxID=3040509 RepID=A0ABY8WIS8_9ACTN|nr:nuclear transport factor 2 family protein [Actinoplanes oblitus]WIM95655.1 nuclear transport factor 2 family protein [Actinoplanes oblitus]
MDRVEQFFQTFTALAPEEVGGCFADSFLSADATGARPVSRAEFLRALPRRAAMFAALGVGRAELTRLTSDRLDDNYVLVRTEWAAPRLSGGAPVPMVSSYLLHDDGTRLEIVLYLNHETPLPPRA